MDDSNPYQPSQTSSRQSRTRSRRLAVTLMALGVLLISIAFYMCFFAESFTFYTPYSAESSDWILHLPNGVDYLIHSYVGISAMVGSATFGLLLLSLAMVQGIRAGGPLRIDRK
jgi:ABC-type Fe3+ transport system permease subunit